MNALPLADFTFVGFHGRLGIGWSAQAGPVCSAPCVSLVRRRQDAGAFHALPSLTEVSWTLRQCCPETKTELPFAICLHTQVHTCRQKSLLLRDHCMQTWETISVIASTAWLSFSKIYMGCTGLGLANKSSSCKHPTSLQSLARQCKEFKDGVASELHIHTSFFPAS